MRMEGIWLGKRRKRNGRNKIGKRREWKELGWEEKRMEGIRLEREDNGMKKVGKR